VIITQYFKDNVRSGSYKFFQLLDEIETLCNRDTMHK